MQVATVPDVVVLKPVDIDVQAIRIDVHVSNEMCKISSVALPFYFRRTAVFYAGLQSPQISYTNWTIFYV